MIHGHFHKRVQRLTRAALAVVTSLVLVSAMLIAGDAYAWCPHMQQVSAGCCDRDTDRAEESRPEVETPCCESRVVNDLPTADRAPSGAILAPALTTLAEPVILDEPEPAFVVRHIERARVGAPIRAGPSTALERCVLLQTFLH